MNDTQAHTHQWFWTGSKKEHEIRCIHCGVSRHGASHPPQRKPLTLSEINQIEARWDVRLHGSKIAFAVRETEAAHGIKGDA